MSPLLRAALLLIVTCGALAAEPERAWFRLSLAGSTIGHVLRERYVEGDAIVHREYFEARFNRNGDVLDVVTDEIHRETANAEPLGFSVEQRVGPSRIRIDGERTPDGRFRIREHSNGHARTRMIDWPRDALLAEGIERTLDALPERDGARARYLAFLPMSLEAATATVQRIGPESLQRAGKTVPAVRIDTWLDIGVEPMHAIALVDAQGETAQVTMPMFGQSLVMLRSDGPVSAEGSGADLYDFALLAAPRALSSAERRQPLRYTLTPRGEGDVAGLSTDEQIWQRHADGSAIVIVQADAAASAAPPPSNDWTQSTIWLDSDDADVRRFALRAARGADDDRERMRRLERAVATQLRTKSMRIGYATASESLRLREGDCTEHAVLLAAAGRALHIPTRMVSGVVYADSFGPRERVFVPHAWVQAWIDGRWQSFDAALHGFRPDHLALAVGDGDPTDYYGAMAWLGRLRIGAVQNVQSP